ncbi:hypothetical protein BOTCAL_0491g00010 [Botryotinia calthae]|uniref:Uncharacterized protein n=1 Tax=Botryotinia calthae TaxID=38488 RepID=A0A4Y8CLM4_9HELO|nr:hypothetical protein BOTCAL_0491g00010 [Botryotinia calthae]
MLSSRKPAAENHAVSSYNTQVNKIEQVKNKKEVVEYRAAEKTLEEKVKTSKVRDFIKAQKAKKSEEELKKMRAGADVKAYEKAKKKSNTYVQAEEVLNRQVSTTAVPEAKRAATSEKLMKEANIDPITILPPPSRSSTIGTQNPPKDGKDKSKNKKTTESSTDDIPFDPNPSSSGGEESISSRRSSSPDSDHNKKRRGGSEDRSKPETGSSRATSEPQKIVPPQKARPKNYIPLKNSPHTDMERHIKQ